MPTAQNGAVSIYYEEAGSGEPLIFSHEFGGSLDSWRAQVNYFSRRYRVIVFNARGYPPSDVPADPNAYGEDKAVEDIRAVLDHLGIDKAYVGGLSMGGTATVHFGRTCPERCKALIIAGAGTGSTDQERFRQQTLDFAQQIEDKGMAAMEGYAAGPTRVQLRRKDPTGWQEFGQLIGEHSAAGSALTMRGVQGKRLPLYEYEAELSQLDLPALIITGDEDEPCVEPSIFLKRTLPRAGLSVFPQSGHAVNLEEPDLFNRTVSDFLIAVEAGKWYLRDQGSGAGFLSGKGPGQA